MEKPAIAPERVAPNDEQLVRGVLERYRQAYDGLDARAAKEIWPSVDASALSRAFEALVSQKVTFNECRVTTAGADGHAVCRGSTRFVPKLGARDPRVEGRVWDFELKKVSGQWQIASARVTR